MYLLWLSVLCHKGSSFTVCKYCNKQLNCSKDGTTTLKRHAHSVKHIEHSKAAEIQKPSSIQKFTNAETFATRRARKAEIMIATFLGQHNLPFMLSGSLTQLIKKLDLDLNVKKKLTCNRTKCTAVVCNITEKCVFQKLVFNIQKRKFSVIIEESTDTSSSKNLAIVCTLLWWQFRGSWSIPCFTWGRWMAKCMNVKLWDYLNWGLILSYVCEL